jgi:predicted enzyme related to lactoylglutathione lyase
MEIQNVLAQATVRDENAAAAWYSKLFGRAPDARPMDGLLEWHFGDAMGVQVWAEADRAGCSSVVITVSDLDAVAEQLKAAGVTDASPTEATSSRVLVVEDPDGNRIVFAGS